MQLGGGLANAVMVRQRQVRVMTVFSRSASPTTGIRAGLEHTVLGKVLAEPFQSRTFSELGTLTLLDNKRAGGE